jgi:protein-disulfide isomerase
VTGNPNGDVTIVEFFDYRCPYCKRNHADLAQLVKADPNLRVVSKDFPVLGPDSIVAARATLAAIPQGGYQRLHDAILQASGPLSADDIFALADTAGLSSERIAHDMTSPEVESAVNRNIGLARALGISGTPTFVIGDRIIPGAIDLAGLRQLVKAQRSAAQIPTDTKPPAARDGAPQQTGGTTDARATN